MSEPDDTKFMIEIPVGINTRYETRSETQENFQESYAFIPIESKNLRGVFQTNEDKKE